MSQRPLAKADHICSPGCVSERRSLEATSLILQPEEDLSALLLYVGILECSTYLPEQH